MILEALKYPYYVLEIPTLARNGSENRPALKRFWATSDKAAKAQLKQWIDRTTQPAYAYSPGPMVSGNTNWSKVAELVRVDGPGIEQRHQITEVKQEPLKLGKLEPSKHEKYEQPLIYQGQPNEKIKNYVQPHFTRTTEIGQYLYHGTLAAWLPWILHENQLTEGAYWGKLNEPHGVRFSRDPTRASAYAFGSDECTSGAILVLDWAKLNKKYGTTSYHDTDYEGHSFGNDEEEVVLTPAIKPLRNFLVSIHVNPKFFTKTEMKRTWEYLISYTEGEPYPDAKTFAQLYQNVLSFHPQIVRKP